MSPTLSVLDLVPFILLWLFAVPQAIRFFRERRKGPADGNQAGIAFLVAIMTASYVGLSLVREPVWLRAPSWVFMTFCWFVLAGAQTEERKQVTLLYPWWVNVAIFLLPVCWAADEWYLEDPVGRFVVTSHFGKAVGGAIQAAFQDKQKEPKGPLGSRFIFFRDSGVPFGRREDVYAGPCTWPWLTDRGEVDDVVVVTEKQEVIGHWERFNGVSTTGGGTAYKVTMSAAVVDSKTLIVVARLSSSLVTHESQSSLDEAAQFILYDFEKQLWALSGRSGSPFYR
jgi:hypothetical protein